MQVDGQQLLAHLGRKVGDDQVEAPPAQRVEAVAEQRLAVGQAVEREVARGVVDGDEVLVDQGDVAARREPGEDHAEHAVAAAEVEAVCIVGHVDVAQQQLRAVVDRARGEEPPGGREPVAPAGQVRFEGEVLAQVGHRVVAVWHGVGSLGRGPLP